MANSYIPMILLSIVFFIIVYKYIQQNRDKITYSNKSLMENFEDKKNEDVIVPQALEEKTPSQQGLAFGFLPEQIPSYELEQKKTLLPNAFYDGQTIQLISGNNYFGMSEKNDLLPMFLERLGTFTPYSYQSLRVHVKDDNFNVNYILEDIVNFTPPPIYFNKTIVCFSIKHLQENYFLQYLGSKNTFYLSKKPSFFVLIHSTDSNSEKEVTYDSSILIKCLDNSEFLLIYENYIITEDNKSSTFVIKKSESRDICLNFSKSQNVDMSEFLPEYLDETQANYYKNVFKKNINDYILTQKADRLKTIQTIQNNNKLLQEKINNLKEKDKIGVNSKKKEFEDKFILQKQLLDKEMKDYVGSKTTEFEKTKNDLITKKTLQWEKELADLKIKCRKTK